VNQIRSGQQVRKDPRLRVRLCERDTASTKNNRDKTCTSQGAREADFPRRTVLRSRQREDI